MLSPHLRHGYDGYQSSELADSFGGDIVRLRERGACFVVLRRREAVAIDAGGPIWSNITSVAAAEQGT